MFINIKYDKNKDKGIIESDFLANIREHFSEEDETAGIKKAMFKSRRSFVPSRKYIITDTGRFDLGLLPEIVKFLKTLRTPFKFIFTKEFKQRYACAFPFDTESTEPLKFELRDYQEEGVIAALKAGSGVELVPTAAGKTLMMGSLIHTILQRDPSKKVLLITLTHLIDQIYDEFIEYGIDPKLLGRWSGEHSHNPDAQITICGTTILYSKIEDYPLQLRKAKKVRAELNKALKSDDIDYLQREKFTKLKEDTVADIDKLQHKIITVEPIQAWLRSMGLLVVDEVHVVKKDNQINQLLKYVTTRNRFGFTGTMPESMIDQWNIMGKFGSIIHEVSRELLVEQKHIADTNIQILRLSYIDDPSTYDEDEEENEISEQFEEEDSRYEKELQFIHTQPFRNETIKKVVGTLNKNSLIVFDRLDHGDHLYEYLTAELPDKQIFLIKGEVAQSERDKIIEIMEKNDNVICIAVSKIFSTGINIKNLHYIVFAQAGKAKVKTIQTIGRGVRMLLRKFEVVIFDIADNLHYGNKHLDKRRQVYDNEKMRHRTIEVKEG